MVLPPSFPDPWPKLCKPRGWGSGDQLRVNSPEHHLSRALTTRAWFTGALPDVEWVTAEPWTVSFPSTVVKSSGVHFSHLVVFCDESTPMGHAATKCPQAHVPVHATTHSPVVSADLWAWAAARAVETV